MINKGVMLPQDASSAEIVSVLNELIGNYNETEPLPGYVTFNDANSIWILLCGYLVFFMHAGFSMLEAGSVRHKNAVNIMFKNIATIAVGGLAYYLFGFAFAYGSDNGDNGFIGSGNYAQPGSNRASWFFQFAFAATGATIVSGAIAGRVMIEGYLLIAAWMTAFVYPVVSHWIWATGGFMSAFTPLDETLFASANGCGVIDFAGSGVVHMTGGVAAFWAALITGPRLGRFGPEGQSYPIPPHNMAIVTLGTFILWFGWYGFNCGSTLQFNGSLAAKAAVTTTLSPALSALTAIILSKCTYGHFELGLVLNSALGGLVGITAGCTVVEDWAALIIGIVSCFVYYGGTLLMVVIKVDDPVEAISVHGFCGLWGLLAVGIFATPENIAAAYSGRECDGWETGLQFASQLTGALTIIAWVTLTTVPVLLLLKISSLLRVPPHFEEIGLDHSEHGGQMAFIANEFVRPMDPSKPTIHTHAENDVEAADTGAKSTGYSPEVSGKYSKDNDAPPAEAPSDGKDSETTDVNLNDDSKSNEKDTHVVTGA
mmetsp:Transcript_32291/g.39736  ORF Transcript_32291/g.39736 Transcript_32291/m.39736 type:complete len:542 (-) Transcript_32291:757-2382(-)|eukprot:CAMPEP_0204834430 /NCGR_PEP_ID=MMETSP1346-20131115/19827_1 /ASSEMBLY_ACC=CAM_ASM_000771 /TAXON_ID=215587 /ORGANISM="Aplanochytrium stocchinoi, Strain GSBS06" /LENGTH=541 /DNA_ID=CAMNT_0051967757 /DNA_START=94 /DNA_END=1719 /DNA_ORIENTATION=-